MEHESWKHFYLQDGECWLIESGLEKYYQRIQTELYNIDKAILKQSFGGLAKDYNFKSEYSGINYYQTRFELETWDNDEIDKIQAPPYGRSFLDERIQYMKDIGGKIANSSYNHISEVMNSCANHGTWSVPIIVVQSIEFSEFDYAKPYQLFDGHNRLAWFKYFLHNNSTLKLAPKHLVWVLHNNPQSTTINFSV